MSATPILLFNAAVANVDSEIIDIPISQQGPAQRVVDVHYAMIGTWDTATMTLEMSIDGGTTWFILATKTADAQASLKLGPCKLKFVLSSVGGSTDLDASIAA